MATDTTALNKAILAYRDAVSATKAAGMDGPLSRYDGPNLMRLVAESESERESGRALLAALEGLPERLEALERVATEAHNVSVGDARTPYPWNPHPLHDALEACSRFRLFAIVDNETLELGVDVARDVFAQDLEIHVASPQDSGPVGIVDQRKQQVFERGEFMTVFVGDCERPTQRLF